MSDKLLTIGMATYDDYDGVFFSIQSLRMHHDLCNTDQIEYIVVDNNPTSPSGQATKKFVEGIKGKYIPYTEKVSSFNKYLIPNYANGKYVLIMDSHVLLERNSIDSLLQYYKDTPNCRDLVQGPLIYNDLKHISTHFDPVWRGDMYGIWATNKEANEKGLPFEIPMQGMGLLSFEKEFWPGIHPNFFGFGAEEGYISEKFRQAGGKNICLPQLRWMHRFDRPAGVKFRLALEDRVWNYFIGWLELYKDPEDQRIKDIYNHFKDKIPAGRIDSILEKAIKGEKTWQ
mgnify:CR=1 FL=1|jgi:hypothetical protein